MSYPPPVTPDEIPRPDLRCHRAESRGTNVPDVPWRAWLWALYPREMINNHAPVAITVEGIAPCGWVVRHARAHQLQRCDMTCQKEVTRRRPVPVGARRVSLLSYDGR